MHAGKCAGTSIKDSLNASTKEPSYLTSGHSTLLYCKKEIIKQGNNFDDYYIFSITRNPWDRMVSWYYHAINTTKSFSGTFDEFIKKRLVQKNENLIPPYNLCDFVIEFENLQEDFKEVLKLIGLSFTKLPHRSHNSKRPNKNYRDHYSDISKITVENYFSDTINKFHYSF